MRTAALLALKTTPGPAAIGGDWPAPPPEEEQEAEPQRQPPRALPEGIRLNDYEIVGPIGEGGFGIVYLALDPARERHVAIKEYMPAALAARDSASPAVVLKSPSHQASFRIGLRSFVNEARILARFDHPSLVRVLQHWEANGTAYMPMPYHQGPTLGRALADLGRPPEEAELRGWLRPLLDALGTLHAVSCLHRDIAPDNILLTDTGPVLLDFGAARRVIDAAGPSPAMVFKPGFTPLEQYGELASMRQGPWTDLYALGAVVYAAITGQPPVSSVERMPEDPLQPLAELAEGRYSARFLEAIDAALSVHPKDRPQSAAEFWARMGGDGADREAPGDAPGQAPAPSARVGEARSLAGVAHGFVAAVPVSPVPRAEAFTTMMPRPRVRPAPVRRRRFQRPVLAATALLLVLAAAGYLRIGDPARTEAPMAVLATQAAPPAPPVAPAALVAAALARASMPASEQTPVAQAALRALGLASSSTEAIPRADPVATPSNASDMPEPILRAEAPAPLRAAPPPAPAVAAGPAPKPAIRAAPEPARAARRAPRPPADEAAPQPALAIVHATQADTAPQAHAHCADILQRASLEPTLGAGEAALVRKGCE